MKGAVQCDPPCPAHICAGMAAIGACGLSRSASALRPFRGSFQGERQQSHRCTNCGRPWMEHVSNPAHECPEPQS